MKKLLSVVLVITIIFSSMANFSLMPWSELIVKSSAVADVPIFAESDKVNGEFTLSLKLKSGVSKLTGAIIHIMYDTELVECTSFEAATDESGNENVPGVYTNGLLASGLGYSVGYINASGYSASVEKEFFNLSFRFLSTDTDLSSISVYVKEINTDDGIDNDVYQSDTYILAEYNVTNPIYSILTFTENNDGTAYSVTDCDPLYSGAVSIPSQYNGLPVTAIGTDAFRDCVNITGIKIPDSVKSVGGSAFRSCTSLKEIVLPQGLTTISGATFNGCIRLQRVVIPSTIISVGGYAFGGCSALRYVFFGGDEAAWSNITVGGNNTALTNSYIHYNSTGEHTYSDEWTVDSEPTCTQTGIESQHCLYCDVAKNKTVIPATGHTFGDFEIVTAPDCVTNGQLGKTCSVCGELELVDEPEYTLIDSSEYPESDHNYKDSLVKTYDFTYEGAKILKITFSDSTYTESGYDFIYLYDSNGEAIGTYDGNELAGQTFEIEGDSFSIKLKTDSSNNYYGFSFSEISFKPDYPDIAALGHSYGEWSINTSATCTEKGERQKVCSACGDIFKEEIEAIGHNYGEVQIIKEPTCFEAGYCGKVCENCGDEQILDTSELGDLLIDSSLYPESPHNYTNNFSKTYKFSQQGAKALKITFSNSTSTESNYDFIYLYDSQGELIGEYDGTVLAGKTFEIEGDSFSIKLTSDGSQVYYGFSFSEISYIPTLEALGHSYGEWSVETDYTCTEDGVMVQVCESCGDAVRKSGEDAFTDLLIDRSLYPEGEYSSDEWDESSQYDYYFEYQGEKEAKGYKISFNGRLSDSSISVYDGSDNRVYYKYVDENDSISLYDEVVTVEGSSFRICVYEGMYGSSSFSFNSIIAQVDLTAAHRFEAYETIIAPTFLEDGLERSTCSGCGLTKDRVAPALYKTQLTFDLNDDKTGYIITKCNTEASGDITLPSEYNGLPVVGIGYMAFSNCRSIQSMVIPETITSIEGFAFSNCYNLYNLEIPQSITYISSDALQGSYIANLTINNDYCMKRLNFRYSLNVYSSYLYPLSTLNLGKYVSYFDMIDFYSLKNGYNCLFKNVTVDSENPYFCSEDGVLYNERKTELIFCPVEKTELIIPDTVKNIGVYAFYKCDKLTSVQIPDSVKAIKEYAFSYCSALTSVFVPGNVTTIGNQAFGGCYKLSEITLSEGVTTLGEFVFYDCTKLENIVLPSTVKSLVGNYYGTDYHGTFYGCPAETVTVNNNYCAAVINCYSFCRIYEDEETPTLKKMILGPDVTEVSTSDAYYGYKFINAGNVEVDPENRTFCVVDGVLMTKDKTKIVYFPWGVDTDNYVIPDSVTTIGEYAFRSKLSASAFDSLTIHSGVKCFETEAFYNYRDVSRIRNLYLPEISAWCGVNLADYSANPIQAAEDVYFNGENLTELVIPGEAKEINDYALAGLQDVERLVIEEGVEAIGQNVFSNMLYLEQIELPSSINSISNYSFSACYATRVIINNDYAFNAINVNEFVYPEYVVVVIGEQVEELSSEGAFIYNVIVDEENENFCVDNGVLFNEDKTKLIYYPLSCGNEYRIPDTVTTIGSFSFCSWLRENTFESLYIPSSVAKIGYNAFTFNKGIINRSNNTLNIEDVDAWCAIDFESYNSNPISSFQIVYFNDQLLKDLVIPAEVEYLSGYAFCGCKELETVVFEEGVKGIGNSAFRDCNALKSIILPESIIELDDSAFYRCSVDEITVKNNYSANNINFGDFYNHSPLVIIGAKVDSIDILSFNAYELVVDEENTTYTDIDGVLFTKDGTKLLYYPPYAGDTNDYVVPSSTKTIGSHAFSQKLEFNYFDSLRIGENVTKFEEDAFYYSNSANTKICDLYLPDAEDWCEVTFINEKANPITVSDNVYFNNLMLDSIYISSAEKICKFAFYDLDSITSLGVADGVKSIGEYAFRNCDNLERIEISGSVKIIDRGAFMHCRKLGDVTLYPGVEKLGHYSFYEAPYEVDKAVLREITIPASTTYISRYAFSNLETVIGAEGSYAQQFSENLVYDFIPCVHEIENALCIHCGSNYSAEGLLLPVSSDTRIDEENRIIYTTIQTPTSIDELVTCEAGTEIVVQTKNNTHSLATDTKITVFEDNKVKAVYTLVICGDLNGDGVCDVLDVSQTALLANEFKEETAVEAYAANGNDYAEVNILSYQNVVNMALS